MLHILVNPAAGTGKGRKLFGNIRPFFDETGVPYQVHFSDKDKGIEEIVRSLTSERTSGEYTDIVLIGGDGSMNGAVNGIADWDRTRLALIPAGSGNDLARGLGIGDSRRELIRRIAKGKTERSIDVGVCETEGGSKLFNISSGVGFDAAACYFADRSRLKKGLNGVGLGRLAYITEAIRLIRNNETFRCEMELASGEVKRYEKCLMAVGMNHRYEGGGFMFCPDASDTDGILDFCVADDISPGEFMRMFPKAMKGRHTEYEKIEIFRTEQVDITIDKPSFVHMDGEAEPVSTRIRLSVYDKKLKLLM